MGPLWMLLALFSSQVMAADLPDVALEALMSKDVVIERDDGSYVPGVLLGFDSDFVVLQQSSGNIISVERPTIVKVSTSTSSSKKEEPIVKPKPLTLPPKPPSVAPAVAAKKPTTRESEAADKGTMGNQIAFRTEAGGWVALDGWGGGGTWTLGAFEYRFPLGDGLQLILSTDWFSMFRGGGTMSYLNEETILQWRKPAREGRRVIPVSGIGLRLAHVSYSDEQYVGEDYYYVYYDTVEYSATDIAVGGRFGFEIEPEGGNVSHGFYVRPAVDVAFGIGFVMPGVSVDLQYAVIINL
jgi:hypothetical protein